MSYVRTYCRRITAITRPKRPGAATCSSCSVDARLMGGAACIGMGGLSVSRPSLMNTTRCSETWHPEQMNVWRSTPRTATVSSGTTLGRINSASQAVQRITRTRNRTYRAPTRPDEYRTFAALSCGMTIWCLWEVGDLVGMFGRRRAPASIVAGTDASPLRFALGFLLTANTTG